MTTLAGPSGGDPSAPSLAAARRRVARMRNLYTHALAFVLGNAVNFVVNLLTRSHGGNWWFQYALIVWTVGLGVHAITVLSRDSWFGDRWEDRELQQYLAKAPEASPTSPPRKEP